MSMGGRGRGSVSYLKLGELLKPEKAPGRGGWGDLLSQRRVLRKFSTSNRRMRARMSSIGRLCLCNFIWDQWQCLLTLSSLRCGILCPGGPPVSEVHYLVWKKMHKQMGECCQKTSNRLFSNMA